VRRFIALAACLAILGGCENMISLNGKIILSVVQPTVWLGMALIKEVDAWIAMNPGAGREPGVFAVQRG
jgi:hypothetical protein